jgi:DNA-binding transcriptional ArsR family regulator
MGELVLGRPTFQIKYAVSLPVDLVSYMSLVYRAVPGSGLHPSLVAARRALSDPIQSDLDLLHGFSGRLLYYMEEPSMRFQPLRPDRKSASYDDFKLFLKQLSPEDYREMAFHSLQRVHQDLQTGATTPPLSDARAWREYVLPALTTASPEDVYALVLDPADLKRRTIGLIQGIWDAGYAADYAKHHEILEKAGELACKTTSQGFGLAFPELTGNRLPAPLVSRLNDIETVTFCPSYYLNNFVSYILYPPQLIVFFAAPEFINRSRAAISQNGHALRQVNETTIDLTDDQFLDALRALGDSNRLRILDLLSARELYAQEIVGRLNIAQSAVSRHLSLLERAGLVRVRPRGGMKYYEIDKKRLDDVARALQFRAGN